MNKYSETFEWIDLPQGRIRYAGASRGRDETPIQTFAVELGGQTYYGQIDDVLSRDQRSYRLEVVSFGWLEKEWSGTSPDPRRCAAFAAGELEQIQILLSQAVTVWCGLEERPSFLFRSTKASFSGEITFRCGWALIKDDEGRT